MGSLPRRLPRRARRLALAYHGVADISLREDPHALFVSPAALQKEIALLRGWGYGFCSFSELVSYTGTRPLVALTFDDGLEDNHSTLLPLLRREKITATVFVVSGWLGRPHPEPPSTRIMTSDQVAELAAAGVEIGAHTVTHPDLTTLDRTEACEELLESRKQLEDIIGSAVTVAAYPYGEANSTTIEASRAAGFVAACRTSGQGSWEEPLNIPRQDMGNSASRTGMRLKVRDAYEPLMKTSVGRAVRRVRREILTSLGR